MPVGGIQSGAAKLVVTASKTSGFAYFDPMDTNQDGVVSAAEVSAYALKHPKLDNLKQQRTIQSNQALAPLNNLLSIRYSPKGTLAAPNRTANGFLDTYA